MIGQISGNLGGITVDGTLAFLTGPDLGIWDISDVTNPVRLGGYRTGGDARQSTLSGNLAFLADGGALQIIDVSDGRNPVGSGWVGTAAMGTVALAGHYAFVAGFYSGLEVVNVADTTNPVLWPVMKRPVVLMRSRWSAIMPGSPIFSEDSPGSTPVIPRTPGRR